MALLLNLLWLYTGGFVIFAVTAWLIHGDFQRMDDRVVRAEFNDWMHRLDLNRASFSLMFGVLWPAIALMTLKKLFRI